MQASQITTVAIIGTGIMGEGIIQSFAQGGLQVRAIDKDSSILDRCLRQVEANLKQFDKFKLLKEKPETVKARIKTFPSGELAQALQGCQFVVETVPEILDIKKSVFAQLDSLPREVILGSNTSSFTISKITEGMKNPERVVGLHYFNPAHIIPLVEIHRGKNTRDEAVETARELIICIGKKPSLVRKEVPGFIINRLTGAMEREVDYLLDEGIVTPEDLDIAVRASFGFRLSCMGPMEAEDMIGLDTSARSSGNIFKVLSNKTEPSPMLLEKVGKGELGIKSGKGWYDYSGKTREQVMQETNDKLLRQLVLFKEREDK